MVFGVKQLQQKELGQTNPRGNGAQGLDNPWRKSAHVLDTAQLKILAFGVRQL